MRLIKSIYDSQQKIGNAVNTVTFFMALRKNKDVRKILSAIARDPEGHSRLPKETFQGSSPQSYWLFITLCNYHFGFSSPLVKLRIASFLITMIT